MYRLGGSHLALGNRLFLQRRARVKDQYCQLSQQSIIATSNEEEKAEEMPVNKSEM